MKPNDGPTTAGVDLFVLASGSQANAMWLRSRGTAILIDAGLPADASLRRIREAGLPATDIQAILLTHEHDDHARGAGPLARALGAAVIANEETLAAAGSLVGVATERIGNVRPHTVGPFRIEAVPVPHDAAAPIAFVIEADGLRIAVATDLGSVSDAFIERARGADVIVLEANYDLRLLNISPYPWFLKNRILSETGHLGNEAAAKAIVAMHVGRRQEVLLAHLSEMNNLAPLARDTVMSALADESITCVTVDALRPNRGGMRKVLPVPQEAVAALART